MVGETSITRPIQFLQYAYVFSLKCHSVEGYVNKKFDGVYHGQNKKN